jgi:RHS repeat-associated protein
MTVKGNNGQANQATDDQGNTSQYTARENDGTGLYYYRARYYMPSCGRFISEDPIGTQGGINLYGYVGGDPINATDPMGLKPGDIFCTIDAAALDAIRYINQQSIDENREFGGWIYRLWNGRYSYDEPTRGLEKELRMPRRPFFNKVVADYHTHGRGRPGYAGYEEFSDTDREGNDKMGILGYLGTPGRQIKRYEPRPGAPLRGIEQNLTYGGEGSGCNY